MKKIEESTFCQNLGVILYIIGSLVFVSLLTCNEKIKAFFITEMLNILTIGIPKKILKYLTIYIGYSCKNFTEALLINCFVLLIGDSL